MCAPPLYVPLRVHGYHSLLTGVDSPAQLLERAHRIGLPAMALTDVDSLAGIVDFLQAPLPPDRPDQPAVRPIVGAELSDPSGAPGRLVALVRNEAGYRNLCRLVSARHLGYDPGAEGPGEGGLAAGPASFDLVERAVQYQEGLFYLADHPRLLLELFGRVPADRLLAAVAPAALQRGGLRDPRTRVGGSRNTHLAPEPRRVARVELETPVDDDLLDSPKTPAPARAVPALELVEAARAVGVATLAVPDVYWALPAGAEDHRVRTAIKHNALLADLPSEWLAEEPGHLPTFAEMCALYAELPDVPGPWVVEDDAREDAQQPVPGAVSRTLLVAAECRFVPALGGVYLPDIELQEGETAYSRLCEHAFEGARRRYRPLRPEVLRRLDYELTTIHELGFAPYFLLVEQIARFAERKGIPCVGRGSAADSLVAYCLKLTDADPLRYNLPFERFLNPARRDRPDIDLDFCWRRRDEVLEHVFELFGAECTAMISTLNRFGLRSAFRESALAHGIPPADVNRWSTRLPHFLTQPEEFADELPASGDESKKPRAERNHARGEKSLPSLGGGGGGADRAPELPPALATNPIARTFRDIPEARDFPFTDERFIRALRAAARLLDAPRHFGLHPGGVVVAPGRITDFTACQRAAKGPVVTQLDKDGVEAIGLVKMDLLGNRALTVLSDCLAMLAARGEVIDLETIAEDDAETAATLREGRTLGCFQIESPAMRNLLKQTGASTMDDVIQAIALIRPGPSRSGMKDAYVRRFRGLEEPRPPHPRLTDLLWDTHGVMLYQEDVMQVAARVAGMDLAEADQLRRALQKRRGHDIDRLRVHFFEGCAREGIEQGDAAHVWDLIANFASFAFCKAHAVTYGRIAYRTAWLKTHHPGIFLAAFLGSDTGYYPQRVYIEEARRLGVPILPPDVNASGASFSVEWRSGAPAIRVGLGQAKGLSAKTLERILATRAADGPLLSLPAFLERTQAHTDEVETLIQCGAFDTFDRTRPELLWRLHLLRTPQKRPPKHSAVDGRPLDPAQLEACRRNPLQAAREQGTGWSGRGLGIAQARLRAGECAALFPEPEVQALVLPGLPDIDPQTRGQIELELLGLTTSAHPIRLFPCEADERIERLFGRKSAPVHGGFHSSGGEQAAGIRPVNPIPCDRLDHFRGGRVTLRGWPAATRRVRTSQGHLMRFLSLEDESGMAEAVLFPDVYRRDGRRLNDFGPLCVTGIVLDQMGACTLHVERIW